LKFLRPSRVAVVTGAGSGIGRRVAAKLALEQSARVYVPHRHAEAATAVARDINAAGGCAKACVVDLPYAQPRRAASCARKRRGAMYPHPPRDTSSNRQRECVTAIDPIWQRRRSAIAEALACGGRRRWRRTKGNGNFGQSDCAFSAWPTWSAMCRAGRRARMATRAPAFSATPTYGACCCQ
jgi:hypothetical protein